MAMKWKGDEVVRKLGAHMEANLDRAAFTLQLALREVFPGSGQPNASKADREANRSEPWTPPHVQTGFLKNNVNVARPESFVRLVGTGVGDAASVGYGVWLEFGTRRMLPRPWFRPTIWKTRDAVKAELERKFTG